MPDNRPPSKIYDKVLKLKNKKVNKHPVEKQNQRPWVTPHQRRYKGQISI